MTRIIIDTQFDLDEELSEIYIEGHSNKKDELIKKLRKKLKQATRIQLK